MTRPGSEPRLRILVIAPSRHPIREPHAGGLEAAVWDRVRSLRAAGHAVTLVAARGSDHLEDTPDELLLPAVVWGAGRSSDEAYPDGYEERVATVMRAVVHHVASQPGAYDLVDNHSLHPVPIAASGGLGVPMLTTLHTPPIDDLVDAAACAGPRHAFVAVSEHTASQWRARGVETDVHANVVDPAAWPLGRGGRSLVWFGRVVPEKGTHLAIDVAEMLGRRLSIAGRVGDVEYYRHAVEPRLDRRIRHVGPLRRGRLARLVGGAGCALVTPCWDEPFGLVLVEALATGTPVVAFDRGGVSEVVRGLPGARLVAPGDVGALAAAAEELATTSATERVRIREHALARFSSARRHGALDALLRHRLSPSTTALHRAASA